MPANSGMLEIAIVGAAHPHVEYVLSEIANRTDVRVVAVADHDAARRAELERRTNAPGYADLDALLDTHPIRAAAIFTEFGFRTPLVAKLLHRGIFAIVDKPMAVTMDQLALIEETLAGRDLLTLLLEKRFYPVTLALRAIIDSGELGEIVSIAATGPHKLIPSRRPAWMFEPQTYGGILADLTVHDIDLALWLTGHGSGTVSGWVSPTPAAGTTNFPALGRAILACDGGPQFSIEVDWIQPEASPRHGDYAMRISGTKGRADVLFAENRLLVETATKPRREIDLPAGASPAGFAFDHLVRGEPLQIPTADALRATRIAILAQESAANGGQPLRWAEPPRR
ncbi:Gfo/Idh/MocA family oxidoreductase [Bradyrhizobium sp. BR 10289]|uniref:Gfo/Idh/MocA family protein n=1 Tax=Bradyrhizobium sp. BR 10289 TaxID=2749993 RepID=UPI001C65488E|nr:Gfo/Idh/MocA family oxidoreductase [Bradyrhizobium sp. BR 10289]MBW7973734.1 Gfo/Idh/MocA family oxidoreductase [Bradyrhizobium sp. BR 10289]